MMETKWAAPVTYGASKFEVMTDEHHPRQIAVVNNLSDARLIAAAPAMVKTLQAAARILAEVSNQLSDDDQLRLSILRRQIVDVIMAATPEYYGKATGA